MKDWLTIAKGLKRGQSIKVVHACAPQRDPALSIWAGPRGWSARCYRCHEKYYEAYPQPTLAEVIEYNNLARDQDVLARLSPMPQPAIVDPDDWPDEARLWLLKPGFTHSEIIQLGAYYHPPTARVVLPVCDGFWQARSIDGRNPKYLNPKVDRSKIVAEFWDPVENYRLVLTEDVLSAAKLHFRTGVAAWALMGTSMTDHVLARILRLGWKPYLWLDPDEAGQRATEEISRRLRIFGVDHAVVRSEVDPKYLDRGQMNQCMEDADWRLT